MLNDQCWDIFWAITAEMSTKELVVVFIDEVVLIMTDSNDVVTCWGLLYFSGLGGRDKSFIGVNGRFQINAGYEMGRRSNI